MAGTNKHSVMKVITSEKRHFWGAVNPRMRVIKNDVSTLIFRLSDDIPRCDDQNEKYWRAIASYIQTGHPWTGQSPKQYTKY